MNTLKYLVTFKSNNNKYYTKEYVFNNQKHYENWYKIMVNKLNLKIVGIEKISEK